MDVREHWERVYGSKAPDQVSWFRPHLETSLALIEAAAPERTSSIIDIGGGASTLVDDLLDKGYRDVTVADISEAALAVARDRLASNAGLVRWIHGDATRLNLEPQSADVWHDRAVFHFLTEPRQRAAYVQQVARTVRPGGHIIVSTFGPEGPTKCSGLDVVRYDADSLHGEFGSSFRLVNSFNEIHNTPFGTTQQFLYCYCRLEWSGH